MSLRDPSMDVACVLAGDWALQLARDEGADLFFLGIPDIAEKENDMNENPDTSSELNKDNETVPVLSFKDTEDDVETIEKRRNNELALLFSNPRIESIASTSTGI
ncbi:hypothetical protein TSAR_015408 [Trichomalopsis sarcophagae]|uniref:Uncharacterized protein n=1 Tax=Trichomalopsis sarcophagae TaxID=543379 RepID=A0A232FDE5_9HYME|nr:hypothetical protein TSAR_015408 [Trichomalopsis sarcophagae]